MNITSRTISPITSIREKIDSNFIKDENVHISASINKKICDFSLLIRNKKSADFFSTLHYNDTIYGKLFFDFKPSIFLNYNQKILGKHIIAGTLSPLNNIDSKKVDSIFAKNIFSISGRFGLKSKTHVTVGLGFDKNSFKTLTCFERGIYKFMFDGKFSSETFKSNLLGYINGFFVKLKVPNAAPRVHIGYIFDNDILGRFFVKANLYDRVAQIGFSKDNSLCRITCISKFTRESESPYAKLSFTLGSNATYSIQADTKGKLKSLCCIRNNSNIIQITSHSDYKFGNLEIKLKVGFLFD